MITSEMFNIWKQDPCTKELLKFLEDKIEAINESLAKADYVFSDTDLKEAARLIGERDALASLLNISWED